MNAFSMANGIIPFSAFSMPANRSYDVFLLERGTELSLITQSFIKPQPKLTVTRDTQIFLDMGILKVSNPECQHITASERMNCVINRTQAALLKRDISCLPFQFSNVLHKLYSKFPPCTNDSTLATKILLVRLIAVHIISRA